MPRKKPKKIKLTEVEGARLYDVFVHFLHHNFGGPKEQRTPTVKSAQAIADHMQDKDGEQLCYELCREYLSNVNRQESMPGTCSAATEGDESK